MNTVQQKEAIQTFHNVGFTLKPAVLQTLHEHFEQSQGKLIMVISHTVTHDFLLGLLLFGCSSIPITMFTHFKSRLLTHVSRKLGMITFQQGMSNTQQIIQSLQQKQKYALLIALAKTEPNARVHSGYFHIAQALQARIIVLGFDYMQRTGYVSTDSWVASSNETYEDFQASKELQILEHIQRIYPCRPEFQVGFNESRYRLSFGTKKYIPNLGFLAYHVLCQRWKQTTPIFRQWSVIISLLSVFVLLLLLFLLIKK